MQAHAGCGKTQDAAPRGRVHAHRPPGEALAEQLWRRPLPRWRSCVHRLELVDHRLRARRSVGCILAELLQRKPLFQGRDYIDQLKLIIRTLGTPSEEDLAFISSSRARAYIKALQTSRARPL